MQDLNTSPLRSFAMSAPVCLANQASVLPATGRKPVRGGKRFTITCQPSKLNQPRVTVTDSVACITTSYSLATAQELVKEVAGAVGMLVCTPETISEMLRTQNLLNSEIYD
jgi:hypothetical protein